MPQDTKLIDIAVELVHQTEKAWLVNDGVKDHWIPKSIGEMDHQQGRVYELTIPEWMATEKGILI
jgi:hypothetical protein